MMVLMTAIVMTAIAQDYRATYNKLPKLKRDELYDSLKVAHAKDAYKNGEEALEVRHNEWQTILTENLSNASNIKTPKMTDAQRQATAAIGGDMMGALQAAGISLEQASKMSDEELMQIIMPLMAQKTGLTPEEMARMQGMSDKEVERYVKSNPEMAKRVQNSQYAQYGQTFQGIQSEEFSDEDSKIIDRLSEINEMISERASEYGREKMSFTYIERKMELLGEKFDEEFREKYQVKIDEQLHQLYEKMDAMHAQKDWNAIKTPVYAKEYFDSMNVVVAQFNHYLIPKWEAELAPTLQMIEKEYNKNIGLYEEWARLYNSLSSETAKSIMATPTVENLIYMILVDYARIQKLRLAVPVCARIPIPEKIGGQG